MKVSQIISSATDIKGSQGISSVTDTEAFRRISSPTGQKTDSGETDNVEKEGYYGIREECITDNKNDEEEAVDFEIKYDTRHKRQKIKKQE